MNEQRLYHATGVEWEQQNPMEYGVLYPTDDTDAECVTLSKGTDGSFLLRWDDGKKNTFASEVFDTSKEVLEELKIRFSSI